jgi:hypothetical protein
VTPAPRHSRALLYLRIVATLAAWAAVVVYAHFLAHAYAAELTSILASPLSRGAAITVALTALVYFVALSLPAVPNLGPRSVAVVFVWMSALVLGHSLSHAGFHSAEAVLAATREAMGLSGLLVFAAAYAITLALPFVPGVEIGLLIMALFGPIGAVTAYLATIGGLALAFAAGRWLPERASRGLLARLGVNVPSESIGSAMRAAVSGARVNRSLPRRVAAFLLDYRHVTLAACLNLPGNSALGGGGGIAFLCGISRQFRWRWFVATVALATAPVPLLVLAGLLNIDPLLQHHGFLHDLLTRIEHVLVHD